MLGQTDVVAPVEPIPEIVTVQWACEYLAVTDRFIYNAIESGDLPATKLAGRKSTRLTVRDVLAFLRQVAAPEAC